jgi:hypothetical protein
MKRRTKVEGTRRFGLIFWPYGSPSVEVFGSSSVLQVAVLKPVITSSSS